MKKGGGGEEATQSWLDYMHAPLRRGKHDQHKLIIILSHLT
jgi:hypothetical protein